MTSTTPAPTISLSPVTQAAGTPSTGQTPAGSSFADVLGTLGILPTAPPPYAATGLVAVQALAPAQVAVGTGGPPSGNALLGGGDGGMPISGLKASPKPGVPIAIARAKVADTDPSAPDPAGQVAGPVTPVPTIVPVAITAPPPASGGAVPDNSAAAAATSGPRDVPSSPASAATPNPAGGSDSLALAGPEASAVMQQTATASPFDTISLTAPAATPPASAATLLAAAAAPAAATLLGPPAAGPMATEKGKPGMAARAAAPPAKAAATQPLADASAASLPDNGQQVAPRALETVRLPGSRRDAVATLSADAPAAPPPAAASGDAAAQSALPSLNSGPATTVPTPGHTGSATAAVTADVAGQTPTLPAAPLTPTGIAAAPSTSGTAIAAAPAAAATAQVAAALVQVTQTPSGNTVSLRLDPAELGQVHIRIDRGADGTADVHVSAERPETLRLLITDQAALHRTLDSAGLSQEGRSLNFSLATPGSGNGASADSSGSGGFSTGQGGSSGGGQQSGAWRQDRSPYPDASPTFVSAPAWQRAGIDITA